MDNSSSRMSLFLDYGRQRTCAVCTLLVEKQPVLNLSRWVKVSVPHDTDGCKNLKCILSATRMSVHTDVHSSHDCNSDREEGNPQLCLWLCELISVQILSCAHSHFESAQLDILWQSLALYIHWGAFFEVSSRPARDGPGVQQPLSQAWDLGQALQWPCRYIDYYKCKVNGVSSPRFVECTLC